jgi:carbon monoxide dehydrogenase subunit G
MKIEEQFTIAIPIDRMYSEINNIGEIGYCIAGVQRVEVLSDTESRWTIEAKAGFMARVFKLEGRVTDRRPPSYFGFAGTGQDVEVTGYLELEAVDPDKTTCRAVIEAEVTGAFKTIVELMAKGPQQQLIRQTIKNLRERLEAVAEGVAESHPVAPPAAEPKTGLVIRLPEWAPLAFGGVVFAAAVLAGIARLRRQSNPS